MAHKKKCVCTYSIVPWGCALVLAILPNAITYIKLLYCLSGVNCEENLDECLSNPCQNGGVCNDRDNGYTCTCLPGFLGGHCEIDVAVCESGLLTPFPLKNPHNDPLSNLSSSHIFHPADGNATERCENGGECLEGPGLSFSCQCSPGWEGVRCQQDIDECASAPCQNGGVCVDKLAGYACACITGENQYPIPSPNPFQKNQIKNPMNVLTNIRIRINYLHKGKTIRQIPKPFFIHTLILAYLFEFPIKTTLPHQYHLLTYIIPIIISIIFSFRGLIQFDFIIYDQSIIQTIYTGSKC